MNDKVTMLELAGYGLCGAYIAVMLRLLEGESLSRREIWATLFVGTIFAVVFSSMLGTLLGIPLIVSAPMGASALLTGMLGMRIARMIMAINIPMFNKKEP